VGLLLSLLPWVPQGQFGLGEWGSNFFLVWLVRKTGFYGLQTIIASGWVRGVVTGLGMFNLFCAFWEIAHFRQAVKEVESESRTVPSTSRETEPTPVDLSDIGRVDEK
jgi:hypothetical protein